MVSFLARTGGFATEQIAGMGKMFSFLVSAIFLAFRPPAKIYLIIHHIKTIGVESLSVVALSGFFTGMVMGNEPRATIDAVKMGRKKMFASPAKAERELGYNVLPVEDALRRAIEWFQTHGYVEPAAEAATVNA